MKNKNNRESLSAKNTAITMKLVGYRRPGKCSPGVYARLGFRCGLEVHQQLGTEKKLFCRCPAGFYQQGSDFDAELVRHMRPTLSELGEYDGTALMEFKTRKTIIYRIKSGTACTYEIDDTPPFPLNRQALEIGLEIALLAKTNIVGELHITRKQYLDGSIPTGFQRTGIIGIEGEIPLGRKKIRVIQVSVEEDSCREVSDLGHLRCYTTDRLGMPLSEVVTAPEMTTPDEAAAAANYIRFMARSTGKVRTGSGAAREDVNVSIKGSTRVEIKGVSKISRIPLLTHNEAFRHKALLLIRDELKSRIPDQAGWKVTSLVIPAAELNKTFLPARPGDLALAVKLPGFKNILSFFISPGRVFGDEIADRLKVIACLEKPNLLHSESTPCPPEELEKLFRKRLAGGVDESWVLTWGGREDLETALETIEERCRLAFAGVPGETRKAMPDGTTEFERVLPGPDRMYPDTDSAPIPISDESIEAVRSKLPVSVEERLRQFRKWRVPEDTHAFILAKNLAPLLEALVRDFTLDPVFVASLLGHSLKCLAGRTRSASDFDPQRFYDLFAFLREECLCPEIARAMLPLVFQHPKMDFQSVLLSLGFTRVKPAEITAHITGLCEKFSGIRNSKDPAAEERWIMGCLRKSALGNMPLAELSREVKRACLGGQ